MHLVVHVQPCLIANSVGVPPHIILVTFLTNICSRNRSITASITPHTVQQKQLEKRHAPPCSRILERVFKFCLFCLYDYSIELSPFWPSPSKSSSSLDPPTLLQQSCTMTAQPLIPPH